MAIPSGLKPHARAAGLIAVYFAIFAYPPFRIGGVLWPDWSPGPLGLGLILAGPAIGWLIHQRWRNSLTRFLLRLTYTWVGIAFLSFSVIVLWEILGLIPAGARVFTDSLLVTCLTATVGYALLSAHRLSVRRVRVNAPGLSEPLRAVQISDVHIGSRTTAFLRRIISKVNRLRPDVVFITGDLVDLRELPDDIYAPFEALDAPAYFVIGNHERYIGSDEVCARLEGKGINVLRDRSIVDGELQLIGIDDADAREQVPRVLADIPVDPEKFSILLYHRPDGFEAASEHGVHLMLCGHTHNGQILPFNYLVRRVFPRISGRYEHGGSVLYVSPGTGTWGPLMRLGSTNEITELELLPVDGG